MHIAEPDDAHRLFLIFLEKLKQQRLVRKFKRVSRLFVLILMEHVAVRHFIGPTHIIDVLDALDIHRKTFQPVRDFHCRRRHVDAAHLLEISELRNLHAVEPNFPSETPRAQRR